MTHRSQLLLASAVLVGIAAVTCLYLRTVLSISSKWVSDASYSHGFLVIPIVLWLVWQKRFELMSAGWRPSWPGVLLVLLMTASWVVASLSGILVVQQLAVVAMVPAIVLAILGWQATRVVAFPLALLFFVVPFGQALVPWLMQITAKVATCGLELSGIPVYRSHMYISIPSGRFEVARACSGLNYFVTGVVLGVLYAYLTYTSWRKRAICILAFVVIPILANGLRVYVTIAVAYLTDMRFGPGVEHVTFGRILFIVVVIVMFLIGLRWRDDTVADSGEPISSGSQEIRGTRWAPLPAALLVLIAGPVCLASSIASAKERFGKAVRFATLPIAAPGWYGPLGDKEAWRPLYRGASIERSGVYQSKDSPDVSVFIGVYGLGTTLGAEMISYDNRIADSEAKSLPDDELRVVSMPGGRRIPVREQLLRESDGERLVWYWYSVGDRLATNEFAVKGLEALAFITGGAASEQVMVLATPFDLHARGRLEAFVAAHASCVAGGFSTKACGG